MKKSLGIMLAMLLLSPIVSANCKVPQINGLWEGAAMDNAGTVMACAMFIKGSNLQDGSGCSDSLGGSGPLEDAAVTLDKDVCVIEIAANYLGMAHAFTLTIDRKRVVATGFVQNADGDIGTATLVKKP